MRDRRQSPWGAWVALACVCVWNSSSPAADPPSQHPPAARLAAPKLATANAASPAAIPESIRQQAVKQGIALSWIHREGDIWVACPPGDKSSCVVLGRATANTTTNTNSGRLTNLSEVDLLQFHQYGREARAVSVATLRSSPDLVSLGRLVTIAGEGTSFELSPGIQARVTVANRPQAMIDTLPRYRLEAPGVVRTKDYNLVKQYVDAHPEESFMVVVTVPALCAPCRALDQMIHETLASNSVATNSREPKPPMKTFILEYFSFADAEREVLGSGAVFPTTMVFEPRSQPRQSIARFIGSTHNQSLDELGAAVRKRLERGAPHTFSRGLLSRDLFLSLRRL